MNQSFFSARLEESNAIDIFFQIWNKYRGKNEKMSMPVFHLATFRLSGVYPLLSSFTFAYSITKAIEPIACSKYRSFGLLTYDFGFFFLFWTWYFPSSSECAMEFDPGYAIHGIQTTIIRLACICMINEKKIDKLLFTLEFWLVAIIDSRSRYDEIQ